MMWAIEGMGEIGGEPPRAIYSGGDLSHECIIGTLELSNIF